MKRVDVNQQRLHNKGLNVQLTFKKKLNCTSIREMVNWPKKLDYTRGRVLCKNSSVHTLKENMEQWSHHLREKDHIEPSVIQKWAPAWGTQILTNDWLDGQVINWALRNNEET